MCVFGSMCVCIHVGGAGRGGLSHIKNSLSASPTAHLMAPCLTLVLGDITEEGSLCKLKGKRSVLATRWEVAGYKHHGRWGVRWRVAGTGLCAKRSFMGCEKDYRRQACTGLLVPSKCLVKGSSRYYYLVIFSSS